MLLLDQDRRRWDRTLIRHGLQALARAEALASSPAGTGRSLGVYTPQAAIAACHARAARPEDTDWPRIVALYELLRRAWPNPVVELNRAVAVAMTDGPEAGLRIVERVAGSPALRGYPQLHAVRADLMARLGRHEEAGAQFEAAAALTRNARERELFLARAAGQRQ